ncbi:MAG: mechanosensitive ion channel family protein [Bacteroidales bacterium]|nr:mechanosensitive ion channel family protein [Candidatus Latescibacterota bacterium]
MQEFLGRIYFGNTTLDYLLCLAFFVGGVLVVKLFTTIVMRRLKKLASRTKTDLDDFLLHAVDTKLSALFYIGVLYLSMQRLTLNDTMARWTWIFFLLFLTIFGIRFLLSLVTYALNLYWTRKDTEESKKKAIRGILTVIKFAVWVIAVVILLDNLGVQVSGLIAGLGIGGIAIALAAQAVLGDLFSYFTIFFDKPFEIGDYIIIGDFRGTVEHIGIKTSRIRSLSGEEIIISNTDLTSSRVRNYKRMERRRILFKLGLVYDTTAEQLEEATSLIKEIIASVENAEFDRSHFYQYGDFSLDIETVYYVLTREYIVYMNTQQDINLRIKREFEKRGLEFAYPTQTVIVEKDET